MSQLIKFVKADTAKIGGRFREEFIDYLKDVLSGEELVSDVSGVEDIIEIELKDNQSIVVLRSADIHQGFLDKIKKKIEECIKLNKEIIVIPKQVDVRVITNK